MNFVESSLIEGDIDLALRIIISWYWAKVDYATMNITFILCKLGQLQDGCINNPAIYQCFLANCLYFHNIVVMKITSFYETTINLKKIEHWKCLFLTNANLGSFW